MTSDEQRIAIAKGCGWQNVRRVSKHDFSGLVGLSPRGAESIVPSFTKCLNAMRQAEESQNHKPWFWQPYWQNLRHVVEDYRRSKGAMLTHDVDVGCATASQRAEAFLKTIHAWKINK